MRPCLSNFDLSTTLPTDSLTRNFHAAVLFSCLKSKLVGLCFYRSKGQPQAPGRKPPKGKR